MAKKMETTVVYWGYIGIMEKKMEPTLYLPLLELKARECYSPVKNGMSPSLRIADALLYVAALGGASGS